MRAARMRPFSFGLKRYSGYLDRTADLSRRADIGLGIKPPQHLDLISKTELLEPN